MERVIQVVAAYEAPVKLAMGLFERNKIPDIVIRKVIRAFIAQRIESGHNKPSSERQLSDLLRFVHGKGVCNSADDWFCTAAKEMPIAIETDKAKEEIYELPTSFFKLVLGKHLKFSCSYFSDNKTNLDDAEKAMLELYCKRSEIKDGHTVLDLGCGWGSLALYIAQKYRNCQVTGISNSVTQKAYIDEQCRDLQLGNVKTIAADISTYEMEGLTYDRIFSIEMFENMKNYRDLLKKISSWMKPDGLLFVEHLCHKTLAYHFEDVPNHTKLDDWIARYFYPGGTMPSANLLLYFQDDVTVTNQWLLNGKHYTQTCGEFVKLIDKNMGSIRPIMESTFGKDSALKWIVYWRTFFMAWMELFRYNDGEELMVSHLLFKKK